MCKLAAEWIRTNKQGAARAQYAQAAPTNQQDTKKMNEGYMYQTKTIIELKSMLRNLHPEEWEDNERTLLRLRDNVSVMQRDLKALSVELEEELLNHIEQHGDIVISETERLYVGVTKTHVAMDDGQNVTQAVLEAGGGNLELFTSGEGGVLVSQPWKYGAVKKLVGERKINELFAIQTKQDLKTGKPLRTVKTFDKRFGNVSNHDN